jgi:TrmH family RNA methyltransferase
VKEIFSTSNPKIKQWRQLLSLSGRRRHNLFLAEGEHLTIEAIKAKQAKAVIIGKEQLERFFDWQNLDIPVYVVSRQVLNVLTDSKTPQGVLVVCPLPEIPDLHQAGPRLMALNRLQDPGNVGAILRTLDAAAFDGLIIDQGCADPFSPKALRASMGAVFRVPIYVCVSLKEALTVLSGYTIVAGDLCGEPYFDHPDFGLKVCLLVGNEGAGLDEDVLKMAHHRLKLPIPGGAESLNASVAAGLMVYDVICDFSSY